MAINSQRLRTTRQMVESKFSRRQLRALLAGGILATLPASCSPGSSNDSRLGPSGHVDGEALHYASLRDVARLIETKQVSPVELTRMMLDRIAALDRRLKSYATVTIDHALAAAHAAEQEVQAGSYRGPLHGVPIAVKDLSATPKAYVRWEASGSWPTSCRTSMQR